MAIDEKEWQDFLMDCKLYKNRVDDISILVKEQEKRISVIERENAETTFQYKSIMEKLTRLIETTIPNLSAEIQAIKDKPSKRLDVIVASLIGTGIGIVGTVLTTLLLKS